MFDSFYGSPLSSRRLQKKKKKKKEGKKEKKEIAGGEARDINSSRRMFLHAGGTSCSFCRSV